MQKTRRCWVSIMFLLVFGCSKAEDKAEPPMALPHVTPSAPVVAVSQPAPPPADAAPSAAELLMSTTKLADAIQLVKPQMTDTDDETSPGALLLGLWAGEHLRWPDVTVAKNETSFALVRKDSDAARGKRMCFGAQVIQIAKEKAGASALFTGLMLVGDTQISSFIAAGSTGELVGTSWARFCGVVIGTHDYSNSAGGKGHAVSMVGMFDLPENRKAAGDK